MVVAFSNPIEDLPPIEAEARLDLLASEAGGLRSPLELPSPSLVFRDLDTDGTVGYTAIIGDDAGPLLEPGTAVRCRITFIGVPPEKIWKGRRFALWMGTDKGSATVVRVLTS
jgi:hypothetical protein